MCGVVGILNPSRGPRAEQSTLLQMLAMVRHRGPDQFGIFMDGPFGMGNARLSILDLSTGQQPIPNEDRTLWVVFNGEIFNHAELRVELQARGHRFATSCDTETVVHAFEEYGPDCVSRFNGQFVIALWDTRDRSLFLARDRLGVRPLFYSVAEGALVFGSEIKALLADPRVPAAIDPVSLDQIFTYWSPLSPRTAFRGISELPPGHHMRVRDGRIELAQYWEPEFPDADAGPVRPRQEYVDEFRSLLIDATLLRLRADVPVGAYLSGGLDSSAIAAIIRDRTRNHLDTFSISFEDRRFDESGPQTRMARFLGTEHQVVHARDEDIGRVFPQVVWHTETPILRTAPAAMFLLSELVREKRFKVVLTGEGADEVLAGYDLFKEAKVRRFWARLPESKARPALLKKIYPWLAGLAEAHEDYLAAFFGMGLTETSAADYSHRPRWRTTSRAKRFFSAATVHAVEAAPGQALHLPEALERWDPLHQAQYLEMTIFLSQYLLSAQSDRMAMAHSVEGRFPFLDHRLVEFCNHLPPALKLRGLTEKYLLKQVSREWLPAEISDRPKQPFRAPIHHCFFGASRLDYVQELLGSSAVASAGLFNPAAVAQLTGKLERGLPLGETDDMALAGILSTQLVVDQFVDHFAKPAPVGPCDDLKIVIHPRPS